MDFRAEEVEALLQTETHGGTVSQETKTDVYKHTLTQASTV